jgi:chromate transporter
MKDSKQILCLKLFLKFLKIGAFTFGGGYAMIPLIRREIAQREGWIDDKSIFDILAVSESTPGPIAVNTATFVGYRLAGPWGAASATMGVVLPSFLIIFALSFVLRQFEELRVVRYAFWGIRVAVVALVLSALVSMAKECPKNIMSYLLAGAAFILVGLLGANSILVLIACALVGLAASKFKIGGMKL